MSALYTRTVHIYERSTCWMVDPPGGLHDTAAEALEWVKSADQRSARLSGRSIATTIEWHPCTKVGRRVCKALASR